jgi:hypothetical protein
VVETYFTTTEKYVIKHEPFVRCLRKPTSEHVFPVVETDFENKEKQIVHKIWFFFHMTTEWVSGGGNHFRHHDFTKNGFSLQDIHLVNRKQGIFLNSNKNWVFFHMTTKWVSGGGHPFCHHDLTKNVFQLQDIL